MTTDRLKASLVGYSPRLTITDAGLTPDPSPSRPAVRRSRLTLAASCNDTATVSCASFYVNRDLTLAFEPGDTLHLARTFCGGLGLSLLRDGRLLLAVGAVSAVPLGNVKATTPWDLVGKADALFQERDPRFHLIHYPVQIEIGNEVRLLFNGEERIGEYDVWVQHGFVRGIPGTDECAAIASKGACGYVPQGLLRRHLNFAAASSAQLLECGLEMVDW